MSKKRKRLRQTKRTQPRRQPKAQELLQLAAQQLQRGKNEWAVNSARRALEFSLSAGESQAASKILAEGELGLALEAKWMDTRLQHLDNAIQFAPNDPRLLFHRGVTLWRLGAAAPAVTELERAVAGQLTSEEGKPIQLPAATFLHQLARLAAGAPLDAEGLTLAEANTLSLVQALLDGKPPAQLRALAAQPLVGDSESWHWVIEMEIGLASTEIGSLLERTGGAGEQNLYAALLHYLRGIAAMRQEKREEAKAAWLSAQNAGLQSPRLMLNLGLLLREEVVALAEKGEWQEVVRHAERYRAPNDAVWSEVVGLAYFHLGYEGAQAGNWRSAANYWRTSSQYHSSRHLSRNLALAEEAMGNWEAAAEAWREMIRRRPRKEDHPDFLDDRQVAAIWEHIADCYASAGIGSEAATCLQNALKYSPDNLEIRQKLADAYMGEERWEAAQNELGRILERDENNLEALTHLATIYQEDWQYDSKSLWRRILALDPNHAEAKAGLTDLYVREAQLYSRVGQSERAIELLKEGLKDLPAAAPLLLMLGKTYGEAGQDQAARHHLLQAYHAAPQLEIVAGQVVHELLHTSGGDVVESLLPQIRQTPGLRPSFWVDQGERVLGCELGQEWARRFFDEAVILAESPTSDDTKAGILLDIYEAAASEDDDELVKEYRQRIRAEAPDSGAVEYIEAFELNQQKRDTKGARRLLRRAKQRAQRANDAGVLRRAEAIHAALIRGLAELFGPNSSLGTIQRMLAEGLFGSEDADDFSDLF